MKAEASITTAALFSLQLLVSLWLFVRGLPKRPGFLTRSAAGVALFVSATSAWLWGCTALASTSPYPVAYALHVAAFLVPLVLMVPLTMACYEGSVWSALFCASAGYTVQNIMAGTLELLVSSGLWPDAPGSAYWVAGVAVGTATAWVPCRFTLSRSIAEKGLAEIDDRRTLLLLLVVLSSNIVANLTYGEFADLGAPSWMMAILRATHLFTCVFMLLCEYSLLHLRRLQTETALMSGILAEGGRQYELSKRNVESITVKCHDIKHRIRHFKDAGMVIDREALDELAHEVNVFDSAVKTGNEALDIILTEKGLACEGAGIRLACIADGSALDFMRPTDIYSLFGNALENAIEATLQVPDAERRSINLRVRLLRDVVSVSVENYFVHDLAWENGVPLTSKGDRSEHGIGVRSMHSIVESYGGSLSLGADGDVFRLTALIPVRAEG